MPAHKDLTGASLHEPKGVAAATAGKVYISDGAGSGVWTLLDIPTGLFKVTTTVFTATGTWTKPADLFMVRVTVVGGGGGKFDGGSGASGSTSSFGSHCSATGGGGGTNLAGGTGGAGSNGDINLTGETGIFIGTPTSFSDTIPIKGGKGAGPLTPKGSGQDTLTSPSNVTSAGGGGGCSIKFILDVSLGATETVTVGSAAQNNGIVVVEEYILV